jgi:hypothetical protein
MGIFSWFSGFKSAGGASSRPPEPGRFGKARHKPPGQWVQTTTMIKTVGIQYRVDDVRRFANSVRRAEEAGDLYGVRLRPDPGNSFDRNAIAVYGYANGGEWHVGFLDRDTAAEINRDLISRGIPIEAELYEIWVGQDGYIDIKIIVLAPSGHGLDARIKRASS